MRFTEYETVKIFLTSAYPYSETANFGPQWLKQHADAQGLALLTEDPARADCILFVENHPDRDPYFFKVLRSPLYREFKRKCVLYHDADMSVTALPTISPSVERWQFRRNSKRSVHYIARKCENVAVNSTSPYWTRDRRYLCSFVGSSATHAVRERLLQSPFDGVFFTDTAGRRAWQMSAEEKARYEADYLRVVLESHFILCPRGIGPCTYRLFESMQLGRAPVIIADEWVEIEGIDWSTFSIRVAERDVGQLERILRARQHEALEMGQTARRVWEEHISPAASLKTLAKAAFAVLEKPYSAADWLADKCQFVDGFHSRNLLRHYKNRYRALLLGY
ncbi:MAG: exostosin family protein [Gammaproteobacteria bacterium]